MFVRLRVRTERSVHVQLKIIKKRACIILPARFVIISPLTGDQLCDYFNVIELTHFSNTGKYISFCAANQIAVGRMTLSFFTT